MRGILPSRQQMSICSIRDCFRLIGFSFPMSQNGDVALNAANKKMSSQKTDFTRRNKHLLSLVPRDDVNSTFKRLQASHLQNTTSCVDSMHTALCWLINTCCFILKLTSSLKFIDILGRTLIANIFFVDRPALKYLVLVILSLDILTQHMFCLLNHCCLNSQCSIQQSFSDILHLAVTCYAHKLTMVLEKFLRKFVVERPTAPTPPTFASHPINRPFCTYHPRQ